MRDKKKVYSHIHYGLAFQESDMSSDVIFWGFFLCLLFCVCCFGDI